MNSYTLRNSFGKRYKLFLQRAVSAEVGANRPLQFTDLVYTQQFIRNLSAPPSLWRRLASMQSSLCAAHNRDSDIELQITRLFMSGRMSVFEITEPATPTLAKSKRTLKGQKNTLVEFVSAEQILAEGRSPGQKFTNAHSAETFVNTLNASDEELQTIAQSLAVPQDTLLSASAARNGGSANTALLKQAIAQKLASGEAAALVTAQENRTELAYVENATEAPKPKPKTLGPQAPASAPVPVVAPVNTDADQVAAMEQAAEDGTPFCEECAAEAEANQNAQAQNAGGESPANSAESGAGGVGAGTAGAAANGGEEEGARAEDQECGVCTLKDFIVQCGHKRKQSLNQKLRIVPDPKENRIKELEMMGVKVSIKEEFGGSETINASVVLEGNLRDDCTYVTDIAGEWIQSSNQNLEVEGSTGDNLDKWPLSATPTSLAVKGKGCTGGEASVLIENYPNQFYTLEGNLAVFKKWAETINESWEQWGAKIFNYAPVEIKPKITPPAGAFSATWGWKEDTNWNVYYDVAISFGLNPIIGIEFQLSLSALKLAGTMAGIPPALSDVASEHLIDALLFVKTECKGVLTGSPHGKKYPDGLFKVTGEAKLIIEGGIELGFVVRFGSEYIVALDVTCSGKTTITGTNTLELNESGLFFQPLIELEPMTMSVKVVYKYLKVYTKTEEKKWTPWKKMELYKGQNTKLLPLS